MTRIVLGLDDNAYAAGLVAWTARLASEDDARVSIVHVVHRSELWTLASVMIDSTSYLRGLRHHFDTCALRRLHDAHVRADLTVAVGDTARELARVARETGADGIAIGAVAHPPGHLHARSRVAHRLERLTDVPITIVPHDRQRTPSLPA